MVTANLTRTDLENLARSFIGADLAAAAGLRRVDSREGREIIGRKGGGDYAGLVFPYLWPGQESPHEYRLRRDNPDLEQKPDGTVKKKGKYLSPPGRSNRLYFPPNIHPGLLSDASTPICVTEGEKKCLSLSALSWHGLVDGSEKPRFLAVGIPGVWNWRGKTGATADALGRRKDAVGPIPDLDRIEWRGRTVYIVFDANVNSNSSVKAARRELAKELRRRGALTRFVELPELEGVNGVDDLLGLKGPDFVLSLIVNAEEAQDSERKKTQSSVLADLAKNAALFRDSEGNGFATIKNNGHFENWRLDSRGFIDWLSEYYFDAEGKIPTSAKLKDALSTLQGKARFHGPLFEVHTRLASHEGFIWLDLCDRDWQMVRIGPDGWKVVTDAPFKFRRAGGMRALPIPSPGGTIEALRTLINVTDADWPLLVAWLVAALRPGLPFPVLAIHGQQGSAKSTACRILRGLIDPNKAPLRSEPKEERDLIIAATNGWIVALDNLSYLPPRMADALCRLSTGGGFGTRKLYENDEETLFEAMRPIILNGIEELATRGDLLDRTIILSLPEIPPDSRRTESDVWREFNEKQSLILGALLTGVSHALRTVSEVRLPYKPRMADFAVWATAAEQCFGFPPGDFLKAYNQNRCNANEIVLEASPVAATVIAFARNRGCWEGRISVLLTELYAHADENTLNQKGWPKRANFLSAALRRIAPNLRAAGITCDINRNSAGSFVKLRNDANQSSPPSSSSDSNMFRSAMSEQNDGRPDGVRV